MAADRYDGRCQTGHHGRDQYWPQQVFQPPTAQGSVYHRTSPLQASEEGFLVHYFTSADVDQNGSLVKTFQFGPSYYSAGLRCKGQRKEEDIGPREEG